jgi:IS5 family transposase
VTLGADAAYDARDFVADCRVRRTTPHVAHKKHSAIDARTTRHEGYGVSQTVRKRIEQVFGWFKTVGELRKTRHRGLERNQLAAEIVATAYNLVRMAKLL